MTTQTKTVWKFPLDANGGVITTPAGARLLHLAVQGNQLCVWAEVDPSQPATEERTLVPVGTGHPVPEVGHYVGTVLLYAGDLVLHYYEVPAAVEVR